MFLGPNGSILPGYIYDPNTGIKTGSHILQKEEGILYAEIDLDKCQEGSQYHDAVGGYQRLDVFDLRVDRTRRKPATFFRRSKTGDSKS